MNIKVMAILAILVAVLAGVLLIRRGDDTNSVANRSEKNHLLDYEPDDVVKIEADFIDTLFVIENRDGNWIVTQPLDNVPADTGYVGNIKRILTQLVVTDSIPLDSVNLLQVGLDNPIATFSIYLNSGEKKSVSFGALNPSTDYIYALREGSETVSLLNTMAGPTLLTTSFMVQGRKLVTVDPLNAVSVALKKDGHQVLSAGLDEKSGRWYFDYPEMDLPVNKARVLTLLRHLYSPQVRTFIDEGEISERESGLDKPDYTFEVKGIDGNKQVVEFGVSLPDEDYLTWAKSSLYPDRLLQVDTKLLDHFDRFTPDYIKSREISILDRKDLKNIVMRYPHETIKLAVQNDTLWTIEEPEEAPAKLWQVEKLLIHVDTIDATRVLGRSSDKDRGFDNPQLELIITSETDTASHILVGNYKADSLYIRDMVRGLDFLTKGDYMQNLTFAVKDLKDVPLRHVVH